MSRDSPAPLIPRLATTRGRPVRRAHGPVGKWWIRVHRWASIVFGLWFVVQATSGAVLLYGFDIARSLHPERYTVTASATPMGPLESLRMVQALHPELGAAGVQTYEGVHMVRGPGDSRDHVDAFVDPGTGRINGIGRELPGFVMFLLNLHDCALACEGMPGYLPWLATPLAAPFGEGATLGTWLLGALGTSVILLTVSGAVIWWPGRRALRTGFTVRRHKGRYARDLDLHRVVGIVAVPFLLIWGVTGAAFYYQWPQRAYFALLPGQADTAPARPQPGEGPPLSLERARDGVLASNPGAQLVGVTPGSGTYWFALRDGPGETGAPFDPYRYSTFAGNHSVAVDDRGGGTVDRLSGGGPFTERVWRDGTLYGLHFGTLVAPLPRALWLAFGLSPLVLGVTGFTVWQVKNRSARNRRRRRRAATTL